MFDLQGNHIQLPITIAAIVAMIFAQFLLGGFVGIVFGLHAMRSH
jgi:hypothetical protein